MTPMLICSEPSGTDASHVLIAEIARESNQLIHFRPDLNAPHLSKFRQSEQIDKTMDSSHLSTSPAVHCKSAEPATPLSLKYPVVISWACRTLVFRALLAR
jgi:hypothetical protein